MVAVEKRLGAVEPSSLKRKIISVIMSMEPRKQEEFLKELSASEIAKEVNRGNQNTKRDYFWGP